MKQTPEEYTLACMELLFYAPEGTEIVEDDGTLKVEGSLFLGGCKGITSLPQGLKVGWDLYLSCCTGITSLPQDLKVGGDLCLEGCTLLPFDESKYDIIGDYKIMSNSVRYILED